MTEIVQLRELSREDLERGLLLTQGLAKRLLEVIRKETKPDWRIRRECEAIAVHYQALLNREYRRGVVAELDRLVIERSRDRHDRLWSGLESP